MTETSSISVAGNALAPALARVAALAEKRTTIQVLTCVRLEWSAGELKLGASNMDAWLNLSLAAPSGDPGWAGCVDAHRLHDFVRSLPKEGELQLTAADQLLTVAAGSAEARFLTTPADEFPRFAWAADKPVTTEPEAGALTTALKFCLPHVGKDDSRYYCCGVFLDPAGIAVAVDGHRLARHRLPGLQIPEPGIIVPTPVCQLLVKLLDGTDETLALAVSPRALTVTGARWTLAAKLIDGTFPEWRRVMPERDKRPVTVDRIPLKAAVARVEAVTSEKTHAVRIGLRDGELTVAGGEPQARVKTVLSVADGPAAARMGLDARYLIDALESITAEQVELHFPSPEHNPIRVCASGETEDGIVVMPVRVTDEE